MKIKIKSKSILSAILAASMLLTLMPTITFASQASDYVDPADIWLKANGRTNELDLNATTTYETGYCTVCERDTLGLTYRVPEYTKSGETAANRGVRYSDGTLIDGNGKGNLDDGTPGIDAYYTGYQWTKSVCQTCGTLNSVDGADAYSFNKNVYILYSCDHNFFYDFDNTTYEPYNDTYHTTLLKKGQYCQFCKGTRAQATESRERHNFSGTIDAQLGNSRFYVTESCDDCEYETVEYLTAKSVVSSYYGVEDGKAHTYKIIVTEPTCTEHGYTTYTCSACEDKYIADYTEEIPHSYESTVTPPTCTEMGYTTYTCSVCGHSYIADYIEMTEHNYSQQVIPPTCTEHGYTIYTCPDCGKEYIGDITECQQHHYTETVTPPTCTEMGYTTYTCSDCGDSYIGNYADKTAHSYEPEVTNPTCLTLGYTTYTCSVCGHSYKAEYKEPLGHSPSEWIIDVPATIESAGSKHIECLTCGTVLQTVEIPQLVDTGHSDEDGDAEVGDYSIILTNESGKPIFDSEITIDVEDNVTIKLPENRLLNYEDRTTVTVFHTDTQEPAAGLQIFIYDKNNNAATGATDENGQLIVPNNQSSTGDGNGTVGTEDGEESTTQSQLDESGNTSEIENISVQLPAGVAVDDHDNRVTVTVLNKADNTPVSGMPVIITESAEQSAQPEEIPDASEPPETTVQPDATEEPEQIEELESSSETERPVSASGITDKNGKVTVPPLNEDVTGDDGDITETKPGEDTDGDGEPDTEDTETAYTVMVSNKDGNIANALVRIENGKVTVTLPDTHTLTTSNQTTVTVLDKDGKPVKGVSVTIKDKTTEKSGTTNSSGQVTLPVKSTGGGGGGSISGGGGGGGWSSSYNSVNVNVTDKDGKTVSVSKSTGTDRVTLTLPTGKSLDDDNWYTITVTDRNGNAKADYTRQQAVYLIVSAIGYSNP